MMTHQHSAKSKRLLSEIAKQRWKLAKRGGASPKRLGPTISALDEIIMRLEKERFQIDMALVKLRAMNGMK